MYEFVADQVFGISGLINLSNIVFLVAFSVRGRRPPSTKKSIIF